MTKAQMASFLVRTLRLPLVEDELFEDTGGNVHREAINAIAVKGITLGCADGVYCPDDYVTRAQMASFLIRAVELPSQ